MSNISTKGGLRDQSELAESLLDHVIEEEIMEETAEPEKQVAVSDALMREKLIEGRTSGRQTIRVLFVTSDPAVLDEESEAARFFNMIADEFSEVHMAVIVPASVHPATVERRSKRLWLYATGHRFARQSAHALRKLVYEQLVFTDGFHPDVVVSLDAFGLGYATAKLAQEFGRPFQLHMTEPVYEPLWQEKHAVTGSDRRQHKRLMKRVVSLRVSGDRMLEQTRELYAHVTDQALLPQQHDVAGLLATAETKEDPSLMADHSLTFLYVGELTHESKLYQAIDAVRVPLRSPSIALVVLGDGPAKAESVERAKILGIDTRVIFVSDASQVSTYMASAQVLVCPESSAEYDRTVLRAAAIGLPVVASHNQLRDTLFTDGENMALFGPDDSLAFAERVKQMLNNSTLRKQYADQARDIVRHRLHEDPEAYRDAYRATIESAFAANNDETEATEV